jgi:hypothetical protein
MFSESRSEETEILIDDVQKRSMMEGCKKELQITEQKEETSGITAKHVCAKYRAEIA